MKLRCKILSIITIILLAALILSTLVACSSSFNWNDYLVNYEYQNSLLNIHTPSFEKIPSDNIVGVETSGKLLKITEHSECYGYLYTNNSYIGKGENFADITDCSVSSIYGETYYYIGQSSDKKVLYDNIGNEITRGHSIVVRSVNVSKRNDIKTYLEIEVKPFSNAETETYYIELLKDGNFSRNLLKSLSNIISNTQPLATILGIDMSNHYDKYLASIAVQINQDNWTFYRNGKKISKLTIPDNLSNIMFYVDGKLFYTTQTIVKSDDTNYNYIDNRGGKLDCKLHSYDISSGKTSTLNTDFVVQINGTSSIYNNKNKSLDAAILNGFKITDGVARYGESPLRVVINAKGETLFLDDGNTNNIPMMRLGNNYLTIGGNIITKENSLVASLGTKYFSVEALFSDRIAITIDNKIGVIDANGKTLVDFNYSLARHHIYENRTVVSDDEGILYLLNLLTGETHPLYEMFNTGNENISTISGILIELYNESTQRYSLYDFTGKCIIENSKQHLRGSLGFVNGFMCGHLTDGEQYYIVY